MPGHGSVKKIKRKKTSKFKESSASGIIVQKDGVHTPEAIDEVGCIHSIQGYDLNYAFVTLGKDIGYRIKIRNRSLFVKSYILIKMVNGQQHMNNY